MSALARVQDALRDRGMKGRGKAWQCPAHDDRSPSLSVDRGSKGADVVVKCHAGCELDDVLAALDLTRSDLHDEPQEKRVHGSLGDPVTSYAYEDADGVVRYYVDRYVPKTFRPRMADGSKGFPREARILYRLPAVLAAAAAGGTVFVCEGEKDVDNLVKETGATATTMPGGTGMGWLDSYSAALKGAGEVVIIADRDDPGRQHAEKVSAALLGYDVPHRILEPAAGKDLSDHLAAGHGYDDLVPLHTQQLPPAEPGPETAAGVDEEAPRRRIKLTPAAEIEPEPVIWAWEPDDGEGRIPAGALTLAAGREGTGKSSFGIWLAAQLSRGDLPGTFHGQPRNVFYAAVEDSWSRTLVPRLIAAGADLNRVFRVDVADVERGETMLSLPMDCSLLEEAIAEHDVAALIVDPLMSTLGSGTDAHRTQDVRQALEPLVRMAERTKALTLGIAHFNKGSGTDASQLISGSGAFKDLARAVLAFARDRETEQQVMTQTKNSLGRLDLPSLAYGIESHDVHTKLGIANVGRLVFTGVSERSVEDTLAAPVDPDEASERDEAVDWLTGYLTDEGGEAPAGDVLKAGEKDGFSKRTLQRARVKAGVKSQKSGFGKGWAWVLTVTEGAEGDTKMPKAPGPGVLASSAPSVAPTENPSPNVTPEEVRCTGCSGALDPLHAAQGETTHPGCEA